MKIFAYALREYDEKKYFDYYSKELGFEYDYTSDYPCMENVHLAKGYDAVSTINNPLNGEIITAWHELGIKYLAGRCIGYDHMDRKTMKKLGMRGVHATYSPNSVANYTIMLMLMCCRKIDFIIDSAKMQDFVLEGKMGREISTSTVGIIGTGKIGETVIRHLSGFGCRILCNDVYEKEELKQFAEYVDLDTIYRECDIISLHVPGVEANRHMINADTIAKMQDDVILINAARGTIVDTDALIEGLSSGKIAAAALDTFEEETGMYYHDLRLKVLANEKRSILQSFPNVILSPHMAFYTEQAVSDMTGTTVKGIMALSRGEEDSHEVPYDD